MSITFKGFEKIGIDTAIFVNLVRLNIDLEEFRQQHFALNNILFYAKKSHHEFMGVLIGKYKFEKEKAIQEWNKLVNTFGLNLIPWRKGEQESYIARVLEANKNIAKERNCDTYAMDYTIGKADVEIIASFLKGGITKIYTSDRAFHETCKKLGLQAKCINLPEFMGMKRASKCGG